MNAALSALALAPCFDGFAFDEAVRKATIRAQHSFFDSHVIENEDGSYSAIDEGDYNALPMHVIERIVYTAPGMMADDFDATNIARAASFISVTIDPDFDDDVPF